ncbi:glycerate kinase type-2 family protein [Halopiger aswanensis]|uniref:Glycerate 2-kinase n=1 Tax=Halopiger aswanensis TaxID=148449 RepID=A0A419VXV4_9EURY|nr:DUF4147 domain-containing protein [Halopiger aswanensis]RKD88009.1 glycerate 2-kinase [Halopiger aswanensis]
MIENRQQISGSNAQELALDCVTAGIEAANPETVIPEQIGLNGNDLTVAGTTYDLGDYERILIVGGGNAAATVAQALEDVLGNRLADGAIVTDNPVETASVSVLPGDHPVPSERGVESTRELLSVADEATEDDLVLAVITGGGSALLPAPAADISLADLQKTTEALLASGATIHEINAVRKHLSDVKGGQLAATLAPATVVGVILSDVVGNNLDVIASGPITPDQSTFGDALDVMERYDVDLPTTVVDRLRRGANGEIEETPDAGDQTFRDVDPHIIADGNTALRSAAAVASDQGYEPLILSSRVRGEATEAAKTMAAIAEECIATGEPVEPPAVLLSGGETTVTITGDGTGGPNQEFALSAALERSEPGITVASVDTDGIDGKSDAAGGIVGADTDLPQAEAQEALANNDAGGFLERHDGVILTGATNTNVNDLRVLVVEDE